MGIVNRFASINDEERYYQGERHARVKSVRAVLLISMGIVLVLYLFSPQFSSERVSITYNFSKFASLISLALFYYTTGTRHYIEKRWTDLPALAMSVIPSVVMLAALSQSEGAPLDSFAKAVTFYLGSVLFATAITVVANFRVYFIWSLGAVAVYAAYAISRDIPLTQKVEGIAVIDIFLIFGVYLNWEIDRRAREIFSTRQLLDLERDKTEALLHNVLPQSVAKRLQAGEVVVDSFSDLSVIFIDIVGFSKLAKQLSPGHLVKQINEFFLIADRCADRYGIEKVKTIGDAYLAVAGGTASVGRGAREAVCFATDVIGEMGARAQDCGIDIKLRCGIHSGPVVGGVVGASRLAYDYWGDTMNIASRIEGAAEPNCIAVSAAAYSQCAQHFEFEPAEMIALKGVGDTEIYRLTPGSASVVMR